jgi:hypothetical protein
VNCRENRSCFFEGNLLDGRLFFLGEEGMMAVVVVAVALLLVVVVVVAPGRVRV